MGALGTSWTELTDTAPALMFLTMATTMTLPMVGWMAYRGHGRRAGAEMSASMFVPTLAVPVQPHTFETGFPHGWHQFASEAGSSWAAMALLFTSCICYGIFAPNLFAMTQTMAGPRAAGKWTGFQNGFGNLNDGLMRLKRFAALRVLGELHVLHDKPDVFSIHRNESAFTQSFEHRLARAQPRLRLFQVGPGIEHHRQDEHRVCFGNTLLNPVGQRVRLVTLHAVLRNFFYLQIRVERGPFFLGDAERVLPKARIHVLVGNQTYGFFTGNRGPHTDQRFILRKDSRERRHNWQDGGPWNLKLSLLFFGHTGASGINFIMRAA